MKVYEEYIYIIDQAIEAKLNEKFPQEQIDQFYKTFKENFKSYEAINYDTVELLSNSIDFEKFKQTMLRFKDGFVDEKEESTN